MVQSYGTDITHNSLHWHHKMADSSASDLITGLDNFEESVDLSVWVHHQDPISHQKKSDYICEIIRCGKLEKLVLESGWEVNEALNIPWDEQHKPMALLSYVCNY